MATRLFDASIIGPAEAAVDVVANVPQAATACSTIGATRSLDKRRS